MDYSNFSKLNTQALESSIAGYANTLQQLKEAKESGLHISKTIFAKFHPDIDPFVINWHNMDFQLQELATKGVFDLVETILNGALSCCQEALKTRTDGTAK